MKKNIRNTILAVGAAIVISLGATGCAGGMATQEELSQLDAINMEIQGLEQQKASLQKEHDELAAAVSNKESQLNDINKRKSELGQSGK